jgi:NAD(P)-dependent dehydrogenase (short-subunit alcohol dehydrogenase family)
VNSVHNKTVVLTGGTKGIGRAIALQLAQQKYNIVLNYHHDDHVAQETLMACRERTANVILVKADVSKKGEVKNLFQECLATFSTLDVLINNAGINIDKPLQEISEDDWDQVVDINMKGVFLCAQFASTMMLQQEHGGIILNIGASTGIRGRKNGINYCASKAGILVMTKCLAMELAPKIRVNCVIPGLVWTEDTEKRLHLDDPHSARLQEVPLGRVGLPEEIAHVVAFLLSSEASYINGQKIIVDGGQYMW